MTVPDSSRRLVTVFGGSGFLGRYVVRALAQRGYRILVAVRRPDLAGHLQPYGTVGQIKAIQANLRYRWSVDRAVEGADAVVNLVGILAPQGRQSFEAVQAFGPRAIAEAARGAGITRLVHVSAIGADAQSAIGYLRSKGLGERGVLETVPEAVVMRPSTLFGPGDGFFRRFAAMSRLSPVLPLFGSGQTRFQPVFAGDVGEAVARGVDGLARPGTIYELGGPEIMTFREILERVLAETGRRRALLPLPFWLARTMGRVLELLPGAPLTADQVRMLERDNVVSEAAAAEGRTLAGLGIAPTAAEIILPTYLSAYREYGQFTQIRPGAQP
ncbi:complex I NDUFA9 subunit family protein [Propylenella binzhouense]|uniref:Complex I NDUFA9 subunit family protein n=1 Tax=Propylenella binzhouense TaxID=2555902 RepID=A0A964WV77_9HYPH|nr:complex I NDUFA9 subunit family protein [Propylenella binzhouense]MYZ49881.1 complex I NDUFA9 subunit family protein [Propylenella binzhouense]